MCGACEVRTDLPEEEKEEEVVVDLMFFPSSLDCLAASPEALGWLVQGLNLEVEGEACKEESKSLFSRLVNFRPFDTIRKL